MSKTTKKQQLQLLLTLMEAHPDIARGFHKGGKEDLARFWRKVEVELNSIGPPIKNVTEWKKVWADQKKYVRQKAAQNLKAQKGTGGGPNTQHLFSSYEKGIYNLIQMKDAVGGVAAKTFGLESLGQQEENSAAGSTAIATACQEENLDIVEDLLFQVEEELNLSTPALPNEDVIRKTPMRKKKYTPSAALEEELHIQKELCVAIKSAVVDLQEHHQNSKKIYRSIDRLYELHKSHFKVIEDLKERELQEIKRHNLCVERLRQREVEDKIEKNRRLLEIEDLKFSAKH